MIDFWDGLMMAILLAARDYFKERDAEKDRWPEFCKKCSQEILLKCRNIAFTLSEAVSKQSGNRVHQDIPDGCVCLPLYGFFLVLKTQSDVTEEQLHVIQLLFDHFDMPFTMDSYLAALKVNNDTRKRLFDLVGVSENHAGRFWVQFYKILYRTDSDTAPLSEIIKEFCAIVMRFSALGRVTEEYLLTMLKQFAIDVETQSVKCCSLPNDEIDAYGDEAFTEHFKKFKQETYNICNHTLDADDPDLNPKLIFEAFSIGLIYQVISRSSRTRASKIAIMDDILSKCNVDSEVDGAYVFKYMEDYPLAETTGLASMAHMTTDLESGEPFGWLLLSHLGGTYNLDTKKEPLALKEACNFIIGMDNYLADKYPMSGFGDIAFKYARAAMEIVERDIDENMTIV